MLSKLINFNGKLHKITGTIVRVATIEDKENCNLPLNDDGFIVDFKHDNVQYRGFWKKSECL